MHFLEVIERFPFTRSLIRKFRGDARGKAHLRVRNDDGDFYFTDVPYAPFYWDYAKISWLFQNAGLHCILITQPIYKADDMQWVWRD